MRNNKIIICLLSLSIMTCLSGCGCGKSPEKEISSTVKEETTIEETPSEKETEEHKTIIDPLEETTEIQTEKTYNDGETITSIYASLSKGTLVLSSKEVKGEINYGNINELNISSSWLLDRDKIIKVEIKDEISPANPSGWFKNCKNLKEIIGLEKINFERCTSAKGMFENCTSLKEIDLSKCDFKYVTDISFMLAGCSNLEKANLNFDISNIKTVQSLFAEDVKLKSTGTDNWNENNFDNFEDIYYKMPLEGLPEWYDVLD